MVLESSFDFGMGVLIGIFICMLISVILNYRSSTSLEVLELQDIIFDLKQRNLDLENQLINFSSEELKVYYHGDCLDKVWIVSDEDHDKIAAFDVYMDKFIKAMDEGKE